MESVTPGAAAAATERGDAPPPSPPSGGPARKKSRLVAEKAADDVRGVTEDASLKDDGMKMTVIDALPADALTIAMGYVGPGRHRYVAGTCRRLREAYVRAHPPATGDGGKQATYWSSAAESVSCAVICLEEARKGEDLEPGNDDRAAAPAPRRLVRRVGEAAAERSLDVIRWLEKEHGFDADEHWKRDLRRQVIREQNTHGDFHFMDLLLDWHRFLTFHADLRGNDGARLLLDCAARGGNLDIVRHYVDRGCFWDGWTLVVAAMAGHAEVIKYCLEQTSFNFSYVTTVIAASALQGHQKVLQYLHGRGVDINCAFAMMCASSEGHLNVVKFVCNTGANVPGRAKTKIMDEATRGGHLHVMQYLQTQGFLLETSTFRSAAEAGNVEVLEYLHANHVPWDTRVCTNAAGNGHLDALKFLVAKGCPFHEGEARSSANRSECTAVVEWIQNYGRQE